MAPRQPLNDEQRRLLKTTAPDAPGQRGQPGRRDRPGRGEGKKDAEPPAQRRLGVLGDAGHDRKTAAPLVPDQPGGGPALRHRPPAPQPPGGGPRRQPRRLSPAGGVTPGIPGALRPGPRPSRPP